jgi:hypothetical protein
MVSPFQKQISKQFCLFNLTLKIIFKFDICGSVHHSTIHTEKSNKMQQFIKINYSIFIWSSTCFGRHTVHHQEPKTSLEFSGFAYVEGCWTCSCWMLSGSVWEGAVQQCIKIYYSIFIWSSTCFRRLTVHHQEPKTTGSLWFCVRRRLLDVQLLDVVR